MPSCIRAAQHEISSEHKGHGCPLSQDHNVKGKGWLTSFPKSCWQDAQLGQPGKSTSPWPHPSLGGVSAQPLLQQAALELVGSVRT